MSRLFASVVLLLAIIRVGHADSTWVSDTLVSGRWTADHSPYLIFIVNVTVGAGDTLIIDPGVTVRFTGGFRFNVRGLLLAVGTVEDSIRFTTDTLANPSRWTGVRFLSADSNSRMDYCVVEYGFGNQAGDNRFGGGIECQTCKPSFSHCAIRYCKATLDGGGVYCRDSAMPVFADCEISHCYSVMGDGGGFFSRLSAPELIRCVIRNNSVSLAEGYGGGVGVVSPYGTAFLTDCIVEDNIARQGGGVFLRNHRFSTILQRCTIRDNSAMRGGGVFDSVALSQFVNCVFEANSSDSGAAFFNADSSRNLLDFCTLSQNQSLQAAICSRSDTLILANSIIAFTRQGSGVQFSNTHAVFAGYCDVFGNDLGAFTGNVPQGLGVLSGVNARGDSCDATRNIFLNPLFADTAARDYHLTALSRCIDAGDAAAPHDSDGTIADIGAFSVYQPGHPPARFSLISPADSSSLTTAGDVTYLWSRCLDPDVWDAPFYAIHLLSADTARAIANIADTTRALNLLTLGFRNGSWVRWWVQARTLYPDTTVVSDTFHVFLAIHSAVDLPFIPHPLSLSLSSYPNPFNATTTIRYDLPKAGVVSLKIFDLTGREATRLVDGKLNAGSHTIQWNAEALPSGMYFVVLNTGSKHLVQKLLLLK